MLPSIRNLSRKCVSFIRPSKHHKAEPKKKIIQKSFWVALRRCVVHLVPLAASIVLLSLNFKGLYIGTDFPSLIKSETINLLLLQIAAKIQELFITASLTTIVFHFARGELLFGDGLPLGLIGSGLLFSNAGYFLSREFRGTLTYKTDNTWRKVRFLTVLGLAGLTAAFAGPSSATLLIPKNQSWHAGGTAFYLNSNSSDLWPIYLDSGNAISHCSSQNATKYGVCPSGGFHSLWEHYGQFNSSNFQIANVARSYAKKMSGSSFYWLVDSPSSQVPPVYSLGVPRVNDNDMSYTFLMQPHAATTIMLQKITTDWWKAQLSQTKLNPDKIDDRIAQSTVLNPLAQVRCSTPQNISSQNNEVQFPTLSTDGKVWTAPASFPVESLNNTASDHLRFQWVPLPDQFGAATIGSVFESAWTPDNSSRVVVGCTVFSAYFNATLFTNEYSFWSGWYPWAIDFAHRHPTYTPLENGEPQNPSNGRIGVDNTWLELLTPPTPQDGPGYYSWQPSTIESIMINAGLHNMIGLNNNSTLTQAWHNEDLPGSGRTMLLETIICNVFVDGLSRSGSDKMYNTTGSIHEWALSGYSQKANFDKLITKGQDALNFPDSSPENVTKLRVQFQTTGFTYQASLAQYLAMIVLFVHILFALFHMWMLLSTRESSDSWDSVSKLIALAQNSHPPTDILTNTSSNIDYRKTYSQKAKIRNIMPTPDNDNGHVELIFFPEAPEMDCHEAANIIYNKLPQTSAQDCSVKDSDLEISMDEFHSKDQLLHSSTWPGGLSTNGSSTTTLPNPNHLTQKSSTTNLTYRTSCTSLLNNALIIEKNRRYG